MIETSLDLYGDTVRCTITDLEKIKRYCREGGSLRSYLGNATKFLRKEKEKDQTTNIDQYDIRLQLSTEQPIDDQQEIEESIKVIERTETKRFYRYKQRSSYQFNDLNLRVDLTCVKEGQTSFSEVLRTIEKYEVEIEFINLERIKTAGVESFFNDNVLQFLQDILIQSQQGFVLMSHKDKETYLHEYQQLIQKTGFIAADVVALTKNDLNKVQNGHYSVTDKADGDRYLLFISAEGRSILIKKQANDTVTCVDIGYQFLESARRSLYDGELVKTTNGEYHFLIFDCFFYGGQNVRSLPLYDKDQGKATRYKYCQQFNDFDVELPTPVIPSPIKGFICKTYEFDVGEKGKNIFVLTKVLKDHLDEDELKYNNDGWIYTDYTVPYPDAKQDDFVFKWKPPNKLSIDFYVEFLSQYPETSGKNRYIEVCLKVGNKQDLIEFKPDGQSFLCRLKVDDRGFPLTVGVEDQAIIYNKSIVEFIYEPKNPEGFKWVPIRFRADKTERGTPNSLRTALSNWRSITQPIPENVILATAIGSTTTAQPL